MKGETATCLHCGKAFTKAHGSQRICSKECSHLRRNGYNKKPASLCGTERNCKTCGAAFTPPTLRHVYCTEACAYEARLKHNRKPRSFKPVVGAPIKCLMCGDMFTPQRSQQKCCSSLCSRELYQQRQEIWLQRKVCGAGYTYSEGDE